MRSLKWRLKLLTLTAWTVGIKASSSNESKVQDLSKVLLSYEGNILEG